MAYLREPFPTSVRASRYGKAYTLAIIIPSFYPFYFAWLANVMSYQYAPVALLVFGGLLGMTRCTPGPFDQRNRTWSRAEPIGGAITGDERGHGLTRIASLLVTAAACAAFRRLTEESRAVNHQELLYRRTVWSRD